MYNLPNILTISRIAVIPLIFISIFINSFVWTMIAGALFIAASITDYLDGYLARAWSETSSFGRLLDPIADKLLVGTALVVIIAKTYVPENGMGELHYYSVGLWGISEFLTITAAFVILCREILVSGLREFLREVNVGLPVTKLAKWKTGFQMTALSMMMFRELWIGWGYLGEFLLWVAAVLTFITGYQYYQKSLEYIKAEEAEKIASVKNYATETVKTEANKTAKVVVTEKETIKTPVKKQTTKASNKKVSAKKATNKKAPVKKTKSTVKTKA